jgi:hypothetical protein
VASVSGEAFDLVSNAVGLIAVILLAQPALYAARYGRLATRLRNLTPIDDSPEARLIHDRAELELEDQGKVWGPSLNFSLLAGTVLAGLSYLIAILKLFVPGAHS